jgi:hypothetical protein
MMFLLKKFMRSDAKHPLKICLHKYAQRAQHWQYPGEYSAFRIGTGTCGKETLQYGALASARASLLFADAVERPDAF